MITDSEYELLDQEIADTVYGPDGLGRERDEACVHGHFDCAYVERGDCANETMAKRFSDALEDRGFAEAFDERA